MIGMERWIDPRVQQVKIADMQRYLLSHGWKRQPHPRTQAIFFEGPLDDFGKPIIQMLPASEEMVDCRQRIIEVITALAVIEDRSAISVLEDVLRQSRGAAAS